MRGAVMRSWLAGAACAAVLKTAAGGTPLVGPPAPRPDVAAEAGHWTVAGGVTTLRFDAAAMEATGLTLVRPEGVAGTSPEAFVRALAIRRESSLTFAVAGDSVRQVLGGGILHIGDLEIEGPQGRHRLGDLAIVPSGTDALDAIWLAEPAAGAGGLVLSRVKAGFDSASSTFTMRSAELRVSPDLAAALGDPALAGAVIGAATVEAAARWVGGARPESGGATPAAAAATGGGGAAAEGGDMTFCQLYGLYMPSGARLDGVVGLSEATTSWNVGTVDMMWFGIPDEEHPFIVMNLYRLDDGRFEQIGQSHIKHGFYALSSHQCGGPPCTYEPGHGPGDWLGTGCTDTYGAALNAVQSGMGPRYEVNPWTGFWYYPDSHMASTHGHDAIQHRLQVSDADLDPAQNPGASYFAEGYYVMADDVNVMNSAAWKPVTVSVSGDSYQFGMSGASDYPNIGFALDAWTGATQTLVAQEIPVKEFTSPDGRCVLAAKATQLDGSTWHYEYALLNVDMDRQVGSFSVPVSAGTTVTGLGFHAVAHHDEPFNTTDADAVSIDNAAWDAAVVDGTCTWSTATNPLRWGTLYNFRFDADAPPAATTAAVGLFRPGTPASLAAATIGPALEACRADFDGDGTVGTPDFLALLSAWGPCAGCPEDLDGNGQVGTTDFLTLLADWGPCG